IADEMDTVLSTSAISPIISDAWDRASGIFHPQTGEVIVQGPTGLPIFIIIMQHTVQEVLKDHPPESMQPGDVFIVNDPYRGGTHTMDMKFVRPFFRDGSLKALLANTGHWPDVGSMTPGGFTPTATDIYQEGLRLPPVKIFDAGKFNNILADVMFHNMRVPDDRRGDMAAQLNSLEMGDKRLSEFFDRFDEDTIYTCIDELKARSEKLMRDRIDEIPDGTYSFTDYMDSDGLDEGQLTLDIKLTVKGSNITFDLSGSSPECRGPFNSPYSNTVTGTMIAVKHVFWDIPINSGCFEPFDWIIPKGSMLNPREPRPVSGATTESCNMIVSTTLGALAKAVPGRVPAGYFATGSNICLGGNHPDYGEYATLLLVGGGMGGNPDGDGLNNGCPGVGGSRNGSIEITEQSVPFLYTKYALREDSSGDGEFRGGLGVEAALHLREGEGYLTFLGDRGITGPYGLEGGESGATADHAFHTGGEYFQAPHKTKIDRLFLKPGDGMIARTPGGGGYGNPAKRSSEARAADVRRGYFGTKPEGTSD
ncbi:MAG: hydantoinase B/oxoprolinase family protein, partial [Chromatiales bacterium]|nr:hydantoinase B/oxoprolinase family protein [Chromatiales bacterium]